MNAINFNWLFDYRCIENCLIKCVQSYIQWSGETPTLDLCYENAIVTQLLISMQPHSYSYGLLQYCQVGL